MLHRTRAARWARASRGARRERHCDEDACAVQGQADPDPVEQSWDRLLRWSKLAYQREHESTSALSRASKVAVLGGGSFGTAMASMLAHNAPSIDVALVLRDADLMADINTRNRNSRYLPDHRLPQSVRATTDFADGLRHCQYLVLALPVQHSRNALHNFKNLIPPDLPILSLSKGLEAHRCCMMTDIITSMLHPQQPVAVLSGPSFAVELMDGKPTAVVAASELEWLALETQQLFASECLRVNTTSDVVGVELAGALKNVLAIAAGIVMGLGLGNNAHAALVAQGVSEIRWLACQMGASQSTLSGLSGVGDIMLTCFVDLSRNRSVGVRLGRGESINDVLRSSHQLAEGVATASCVVQLAEEYRVQVPVLTAVAKIVRGQLSPRQAVEQIMSLPQVAEV